MKCILCGKVTKAGINRHKIHIVGIKGKGVKPCLRASEEQKAKCLEALEENKSRKVDKLLNDAKLRDDVIMSLPTREEEEEEIEGMTRKKPINVGLMDQFARPIKVDDGSMNASKRMKQQNVNDVIFKKRLLEVHQYLTRWVYEAGIPLISLTMIASKNLLKLFVNMARLILLIPNIN